MSEDMVRYQELLGQYSGMIWRHAKRWVSCNAGVSVEDLVQEGCLALWRALQRHDGREGFTAFFDVVLRRRMRDWVARTRSTIRVPDSTVKRAGWAVGPCVVRMDDAVGPDGRPLGEVWAVREEEERRLCEQEGMMEWLDRALMGLKELERRVVVGRWLEGKGLKELGVKLGTSGQWVSEIEQRALGRLRRAGRGVERP